MERLKSIWQIDKVIVAEMSMRSKESDYVIELSRLLYAYRNLLHDFSLDGKCSIYEGPFKEPIYKTTRELMKFAKNYHTGNLLEANKYIRRFFKISNRSIFFPITRIEKETVTFRCRPKEIETREEIFHVPFQMRGIIGTKRFSIPGFPCLYLGSTIECCIEEVVKEKNYASISAFKNTEPIKVYDFCFFSKDSKDTISIAPHLLSYPFKIAISIPMLNDKEPAFCEEYIFPQLLLHGTILQRFFHNSVDGIKYSSTKAIQKNLGSNDFERYQNIVVPAKYISNDGYCKRLCKLFTLTMPYKFKINTGMDLSKKEQDISMDDFEHIKTTTKK